MNMSVKTERREEELLSVNVPEEIRGKLEATFKHAFAEYHKRGGIGELRAKLAEHEKPFQEELERGVFEVAVLCYNRAGGKPQDALELFAAACAQVEATYKIRWRKEHGADAPVNLMQILPGWTQAKGAGTKFFKEGRDLHATETVMVDGKEQVVKRFQSLSDMKKVTGQRQGRTPKGAVTVGNAAGVTEIARAIETTPKLRGVLNTWDKALGNYIARMTKSEMDILADKLEELLGECADLIESRRKEESADRAAEIAGHGTREHIPHGAAEPARHKSKEDLKVGGSRK